MKRLAELLVDVVRRRERIAHLKREKAGDAAIDREQEKLNATLAKLADV